MVIFAQNHFMSKPFSDLGISPTLQQGLADLNITVPTDIQKKTLPVVLNQTEDVVALAKTGTGKTAAFVIPILHVLQERKIRQRPDGVKCLVMAPTHELALQIESVFKLLGKHTRINSFCIHGGVDQEPQIKQLNKLLYYLVNLMF